MMIVVWIFALITALAALTAFVWESFLIRQTFVHEKVFSVPASDLPAIRLWTFGLGFYNMFVGLGLIGGLILWANGNEVAGKTLIIFNCLVAIVGGVMLFIGDRLGFGRKKGAHIGGAFGQAVPPLITLLALAYL